MRTVPSRQPAEGWPGPSDDNDDDDGQCVTVPKMLDDTDTVTFFQY